MSKTAETKIARARTWFILGGAASSNKEARAGAVFLGTLALNMPIVEKSNYGVRTMGTDGRNLYYNSEFVTETSDEHHLGVIAHEVLHVVYQHVLEWRRASSKEYPEIFTMAQEYVVNDGVKNMFGLSLPGTPYYDDKYRDMYTEQVYADLVKDYDPEKMPSLDSGKMVDQHISPGTEQKEGSGCKADGISAKEIKALVARAANAARSIGKLPGGLERLIDEILEPASDLCAVLANFLTSKSRDDYSWRRPNRRLLHAGVVAPSMRSDALEVAICIDTSGSIDRRVLTRFWSEVVGIMAMFPNYRLHLMGSDAKVHSYQSVGPGDDVDLGALFRGGGGTSLIPAVEYLKEHDIQPAALIYLTDGYSDFGEEPDYPVLHAVIGTPPAIPWGQVVEVREV